MKKILKRLSRLRLSFIVTNISRNILLLAFIIGVGLIGILSQKIAAFQTIKPQPTIEAVIVPTTQPTETPGVKGIATTKPQIIVNNDPIIDCVSTYPNCNGSSIRLKQSQCSKIICCQVGDKWSVYPNKDSCTQAQGNSNPPGNSAENNYPPCTIYYPALKNSVTYPYTSPTQCLTLQQQANSSVTTTISVYTPTPTQDPHYQDLVNQHQDACNQAVSEWNTQKQQFYTTEYNNFSSSTEAIQELNRRMQVYQQQLYSAGCSNVVSL
ncbi:MAG TPA: hypothetical protein VLE44_01955 [Candidatus Saccharimonadales bacterium]|nr:hypothetical protein [Candidatus Saccharimonadales bacterium]